MDNSQRGGFYLGLATDESFARWNFSAADPSDWSRQAGYSHAASSRVASRAQADAHGWCEQFRRGDWEDDRCAVKRGRETRDALVRSRRRHSAFRLLSQSRAGGVGWNSWFASGLCVYVDDCKVVTGL